MARSLAKAPPAVRRSLSSVTNALRVLEYLVDAGEAGVSEIARHAGVTVGTAHRLVATLVATGFAEQNRENRRYRPSQKLVALAQRTRRTLSARDIAHEHLVELVRAVHETGNLAILSDQMVLYVDKVTSDQPFGIEARIGSRLPAYCTALGKVLVAGLHDQGLAEYLALLKGLRRKRDTPSVPTQATFRTMIQLTRERGYALDQGEYLPDVFCAAAPVVDAEFRVIAAMSISAPRSRFQTDRDRFVHQVQKSATELSEAFQELGLPETPLDFVAQSSQGSTP
jgi:DNA-binding IclR family transcriptional regulator